MITEDQLEHHSLQWFQDGAWDSVFGPEIVPDGVRPERASISAYLQVCFAWRVLP
jgi:hypothetical protein